MKDNAKYARDRGGKLISVVEVMTLEGEGTEEDPMTNVISYYSLEGELLATNDTIDRKLRGVR